MAVKTITIKEEAYQKLLENKKEYESFSDEILRITKGFDLENLAGILSKEEGDALEDAIKEGRKEHQKRSILRSKRLWGK